MLGENFQTQNFDDKLELEMSFGRELSGIHEFLFTDKRQGNS